MDITISRILESLSDFALDARVLNKHACVTSVQYAPQSLENLSSDVLYIVQPENVTQVAMGISPSAINILCAGDIDRLPLDWSSPETNIIALRNVNDLPVAVNHVLSLFSEQVLIWNHYKTFMEILLEPDNVRRLIETGCQILQQPIQLYNSSFVLIEHADCPDLDDMRVDIHKSKGQGPAFHNTAHYGGSVVGTDSPIGLSDHIGSCAPRVTECMVKDRES